MCFVLCVSKFALGCALTRRDRLYSEVRNKDARQAMRSSSFCRPNALTSCFVSFSQSSQPSYFWFRSLYYLGCNLHPKKNFDERAIFKFSRSSCLPWHFLLHAPYSPKQGDKRFSLPPRHIRLCLSFSLGILQISWFLNIQVDALTPGV